MKIGFFTATYYPTPDGVSHYLRDVKKELEERGHEVHVFSFNGDRMEKNVHVLRSVPFPAYSQYSMPINPFPLGLYRIATKLKLDIIHIHDPFMGTLGYRLSRLTGAPIVATFHTDFVKMKESISIPFRDRLFEATWKYSLYLYRRCDEVFAPSMKSVNQLLRDGVHHAKELPLFVDTDKFSPPEQQKDEFTVQYIGRITRDKGVFKIIEVADLLRKYGDISFVISGIGPESKTLERKLAELGLEDRVKLTGYVDESKKIRLLKSAGVFLYPSDTDTFGISVLEALSSGVPSIVPQGFPLAHYDDLHVSGLMELDFTNLQSVAKEILHLKEDKQYYRQLSAGARQLVLENFSMKAHCDSLISTYSSLLLNSDTTNTSERQANRISNAK